jgi:hypothetical protein
MGQLERFPLRGISVFVDDHNQFVAAASRAAVAGDVGFGDHPPVAFVIAARVFHAAIALAEGVLHVAGWNDSPVAPHLVQVTSWKG